MTGGWGALSVGLKSIRALDRDQQTSAEQTIVDGLIRVAENAVHPNRL
jgi:hypothetical protein